MLPIGPTRLGESRTTEAAMDDKPRQKLRRVPSRPIPRAIQIQDFVSKSATAGGAGAGPSEVVHWHIDKSFGGPIRSLPPGLKDAVTTFLGPRDLARLARVAKTWQVSLSAPDELVQTRKSLVRGQAAREVSDKSILQLAKESHLEDHRKAELQKARPNLAALYTRWNFKQNFDRASLAQEIDALLEMPSELIARNFSDRAEILRTLYGLGKPCLDDALIKSHYTAIQALPDNRFDQDDRYGLLQSFLESEHVMLSVAFIESQFESALVRSENLVNGIDLRQELEVLYGSNHDPLPIPLVTRHLRALLALPADRMSGNDLAQAMTTLHASLAGRFNAALVSEHRSAILASEEREPAGQDKFRLMQHLYATSQPLPDTESLIAESAAIMEYPGFDLHQKLALIDVLFPGVGMMPNSPDASLIGMQLSGLLRLPRPEFSGSEIVALARNFLVACVALDPRLEEDHMEGEQVKVRPIPFLVEAITHLNADIFALPAAGFPRAPKVRLIKALYRVEGERLSRESLAKHQDAILALPSRLISEADRRILLQGLINAGRPLLSAEEWHLLNQHPIGTGLTLSAQPKPEYESKSNVSGSISSRISGERN